MVIREIVYHAAIVLAYMFLVKLPSDPNQVDSNIITQINCNIKDYKSQNM